MVKQMLKIFEAVMAAETGRMCLPHVLNSLVFDQFKLISLNITLNYTSFYLWCLKNSFNIADVKCVRQ